MGIGDRIRSRREELGMTQEELAIAMGYSSRSAISKIEKGLRDINQSKIVEYAEALHTTPAYIMGWTDDPINYDDGDIIASVSKDLLDHFNGDNKKAIEFQKVVDKDAQAEIMASNIRSMDTENIYMIPVYDSVSAGFGAYADNYIVDYAPAFIRNASDCQDYIYINVEGDSMAPKIENGDRILVRRQTSVDSGSIAVVMIDGEDAVVKKVEYGPDWIELISINPYYPVRRFEGAEVLRLSVLGLVKQVVKNI